MRMKNRFFSVMVILIFSLVNAMVCFGHSNGAPAGYSGSPGDGKTCTYCHGGTASSASGWITTNIPPQGYTHGNTYTITVSFTGSGGKGFEVSPQNVSGAQLGTLVAGSGSKLVGGSKYCTHSAKITAYTATWVFSWIAPASGTGNVNFYASYAITESTTKTEFITVSESTLQVVATAVPQNLCSGSVTQLDATATGGTSNYTYTWSSIPPGFSSNIQNPTATPDIDTKYFVEVDDGISAVTDSVLVTVQALPQVFAGNDTAVNLNIAQISLNGTASNTASVLWTTSGDGTFSSATSLQSDYTPGAGDRTAMNVFLTLTGTPVAPCVNPESSIRHITFVPFSGISIPGTENSSLGVSPNPSDGLFTLFFSGGEPGPAYITVTDMNGNIRYTASFVIENGTTSKVVDLTALPAALYVLKTECNGKVMTRKLVIF